MKKRKTRLLISALVLILLLSVLGTLLLKGKSPSPIPLTVKVRCAHVDNALALSLSSRQANASLDGEECRILSVFSAPSEISEMKGGSLISYPSKLFSDVTVTLSVRATPRDGLFYAGEVWLSPAKRVLLSAPTFYGYGEILSVQQT